jgi:hypothetical protein
MAAYLIIQVKITDEAQYQKYRDAVGPIIAKFGGKQLVGTATVETSKAVTTRALALIDALFRLPAGWEADYLAHERNLGGLRQSRKVITPSSLLSA